MSNLDTTHLRNRDPPPPYAVVMGTSTISPSLPHRSPQPRHTVERPRNHGGRVQKFLYWLILIVAVYISLSSMIGNGDDTPDAADRERIRKGWQIELAQWAQEDQERRARLDCEECERQEDIERWRRERAEHAKEIQRLQEERKWVLELGSMWDKPQDGPQCLAYNVRDRVVHFHGPSLCKIAPVHLEDRTVMAERCTVQDGQIVGHFEEIGHPECRPKWGAVYDKGCVSLGENHGTHRVETRLWGLRHGDDWKRMCNTTPATVHGVRFSEPTRCEDRGIFHGVVGIFEYDDPACR